MFASRRPAVASVLVAIYLATGALGHALHTHSLHKQGGPSHSRGGSQAASPCPCELHRLLAERSGRDPSSISSAGETAPAAESCGCVACDLLGLLKLSSPPAEPLLGVATASFYGVAIAAPEILSAALGQHAPRGPPAQAA